MSFLFPHNPVYQRWFHRQTRPRQVVLTLAMTLASLVTLIVLIHALRDPFAPAPWEHVALRMLLPAFGIVVVLGSALHAGGAVTDERLLGTLELHRLGPEKPPWLVIGFLAGAPALLWLLSLALVLVSLSLALRAQFDVVVLIQCWLSIASTALVASMATLALALGAGPSSRAALRAAGVVIGIALMSLGGIGYLLHIAPLYFLSGVAPLVALAAPRVGAVPQAALFGVVLPAAYYQALVQGAALVFLWAAGVRLMRAGERPPWPKAHMLMLCGVVLLFFLGSMPGHPWFTGAHAPSLAIVAGYVTLFLGTLTAIMVTPRYVQCVRAWHVRHGSVSAPHTSGWEDEDGSLAWFLGFCMLAVLAGGLTAWVAPVPDVTPLLCVFLLAASQVGWIAGGLEVYYLGQGRHRQGIFMVLSAFPWLIFPLVGLWMRLEGHYPMFAPMLISLSPVTGLWYVDHNAEAIAGHWQSMEAIRKVAMPLLLNGCFAVATLLSAWVTRQRLRPELGVSTGTRSQLSRQRKSR